MKKITKAFTLITAVPLIGSLTPIVASCSCNKDTYPYKTILITNRPNKTSYLVGEKLDLSGLVVTGVLSNYATEDLSKDKYTTSIEDGTTLSTTGTIIIEVKTVGKNLSQKFSVYVSEKKIIKYEITKQADKVIYNSGETLDLTGMEVTGTYSDNTTRVLNKEEYTTFPLEGNKVYPQDQLVKNFYVYDPNDISNYCKSWIVVTSAAKNFEDASWHEIIKWIDYYYYNPESIPDFESLFCEHFKKTYLTDFIGLQHSLVVNNINYTVTIVDVNHDTVATGDRAGKKALFTFRFNNAISNSGGTAVTQKWGDNNKDYTSSAIRTATSDLADKFEDDVKDALKTVTKSTLVYDSGTSTYVEKTYTDSVFNATTTEMGTGSSTGGTKYDYFDNNTSRKVTTTGGNDTHYWTSTPNINNTSWVCWIGGDGIQYNENNATDSEPTAPFFCI